MAKTHYPIPTVMKWKIKSVCFVCFILPFWSLILVLELFYPILPLWQVNGILIVMCILSMILVIGGFRWLLSLRTKYDVLTQHTAWFQPHSASDLPVALSFLPSCIFIIIFPFGLVSWIEAPSEFWSGELFGWLVGLGVSILILSVLIRHYGRLELSFHAKGITLLKDKKPFRQLEWQLLEKISISRIYSPSYRAWGSQTTYNLTFHFNADAQTLKPFGTLMIRTYKNYSPYEEFISKMEKLMECCPTLWPYLETEAQQNPLANGILKRLR